MVRTTQNIGISNIVVYTPMPHSHAYFVGSVLSLKMGKADQDILGVRVLRLGLPNRRPEMPIHKADLEANNFEFLFQKKPVREQGSGVHVTAHCPFEDLVSIDRVKRIYGGRHDTTLTITDEWKLLQDAVYGRLRAQGQGPFLSFTVNDGNMDEVVSCNSPLGQDFCIGSLVVYSRSTFLQPWDLAIGRVVQVYATRETERVRMLKVLRYRHHVRSDSYHPIYFLHGWDDSHDGTYTETHDMVDIRIDDLRFVMKEGRNWGPLRTSAFQLVHDVGISDDTRMPPASDGSSSSDTDTHTEDSAERTGRGEHADRTSQSAVNTASVLSDNIRVSTAPAVYSPPSSRADQHPHSRQLPRRTGS